MIWCWTVGGDPSSWQIHSVELAMGRQCACAIFQLQSIDMHGPIGGLSSDEFVEGIPRYALDVVVVFGNLSDHGTCKCQDALSGGTAALTSVSIEYPCGVVHTSGDEVLAIG